MKHINNYVNVYVYIYVSKRGYLLGSQTASFIRAVYAKPISAKCLFEINATKGIYSI